MRKLRSVDNHGLYGILFAASIAWNVVCPGKCEAHGDGPCPAICDTPHQSVRTLSLDGNMKRISDGHTLILCVDGDVRV
jgi:hypothetical protein